MFTKFGPSLQLKPLSKSQERREPSQQKPNYHFTQKRDHSENKMSSTVVDITQSVPVKQNMQNFKLPDLPLLKSSNSNQDLTKKGNNPSNIKQRLIIDSKNSRLPPKPQSKIIENTKKVVEEPKQKLKLNHACYTHAGFDGLNEKVNQDRGLILMLSEDQGAFGVFDGHGQDGEFVSQFVKDQMITNIQQYFRLFDFVKIFHDAHNKMKNQYEFGTQFSGTTATLLLIRERQILCGWVGDSRAIICKQNNKNLEVKELSFDHKPFQEKEKHRIEQSGGVVDTYHLPNGMPIGPSRVWVKGMQFPGLAMSRSLGDQMAASVGVSQTPDVTSHQITNDDLFIVVGSDGVWEFLENQRVAEIVHPYYIKNDAQGACEKLYEESHSAWKQCSEGVDDITIIVIFILK